MFSSFIALLLLILLSPIFLFVSILIFLDDGSPIFFKQKRIGLNNKLFNIYKFRTMKKNTRDIPTHLLKNKSLYYTSLGIYLRKLSIDELPQLFNICKGQMDFIGPRPALYNQEDLIQLRNEEGVNGLKPGITGWAQINGRDSISIKDKVKLDTFYLRNKSFLLDFKILILTIIKVITSDGLQDQN